MPTGALFFACLRTGAEVFTSHGSPAGPPCIPSHPQGDNQPSDPSKFKKAQRTPPVAMLFSFIYKKIPSFSQNSGWVPEFLAHGAPWRCLWEYSRPRRGGVRCASRRLYEGSTHRTIAQRKHRAAPDERRAGWRPTLHGPGGRSRERVACEIRAAVAARARDTHAPAMPSSSS